MTSEEHGHQSHGHAHGGGHGHAAYDPNSLQRSDAFYGGVYQQIADWLNISPGTQALEAGSGAGGFTELLAGAVGLDGTVSALDVTPELLQTAKERVEKSPFKDRVSYHEGDIERLPFDDGHFDLVWSSRTVHHLPDQLAGMKELRRVLKPGCRLALREGGLRPRFLPMDTGIGAPGLEDRLDVAFESWFHTHVRGGDGVVAYPFGWTQLLRDAGLANVTAKSFMLEVLPPLETMQVEYMTGLLRRWVESDERRVFISQEDADTISKLINPNSPQYAFHRQDLHYMEGVTVYVGEAV